MIKRNLHTVFSFAHLFASSSHSPRNGALPARQWGIIAASPCSQGLVVCAENQERLERGRELFGDVNRRPTLLFLSQTKGKNKYIVNG